MGTMKQFFHAVATLSGLIMGVGIFGVPYVAAQVGIWVGLFWILVVGAVVLTIHLLYGEVVAATPGKHRLPGYVGRVLGRHAKQVTLITEVVRFWGLQIAYLIVGGTFLSLLLSPIFGGTPFIYSMVLFGCVAVSTFFGLRLVDRIEFYLTWLLIFALALITGSGLQHIDWRNFLTSGGAGLFSPYGVIMVSLAGAAAIPTIWDIAKRNRRVFRASVIVGTLIPVIVTALFAFAVVGVTGISTSQESIAGLHGLLGSGIVLIGTVGGFLAIITSYLVIALYLQEMLRYDFLVKRSPAWAFAVGVPVLLYFAGAQNFISVIDIIGSVFFGVEGVLIIAIALLIMKRRHERAFRVKVVIGALVALFLIFGVVQKLAHLL